MSRGGVELERSIEEAVERGILKIQDVQRCLVLVGTRETNCANINHCQDSTGMESAVDLPIKQHHTLVPTRLRRL